MSKELHDAIHAAKGQVSRARLLALSNDKDTTVALALEGIIATLKALREIVKEGDRADAG